MAILAHSEKQTKLLAAVLGKTAGFRFGVLPPPHPCGLLSLNVLPLLVVIVVVVVGGAGDEARKEGTELVGEEAWVNVRV